MTDMVNVVPSQGNDIATQSVLSSAPVQESPAERIFKQSEVNDIVKRGKSDAVDSYRRLQTEQPEYARQKYGDHSTENARGISPDDFRRIAAEEAQRHVEGIRQEAMQKAQEAAAQRTVNNFLNKLSAGHEKYQDFDKVTGDLDLQHYPHVVQLLADHADNAHDIMYDLAKDRMKLAVLEYTASKNQKDALYQLNRLSQSLKDNEQAGKVRLPNEPLSQVKPSNLGSGDDMSTVRDLRNKYRA